MIGWKLFRLRKDGTLGPLFINRTLRLVPGRTYRAECHPTAGFAVRPGWHVCARKSAPHLSKRGRVWRQVEIAGYEPHQRPRAQGGLWYTANFMRIL